MNNAHRLRVLNNALLISGQDYSDTLLDSALELDKLRGLLREMLDGYYADNLTQQDVQRRVREALGEKS